jgi:hypothetical protein
VVVALKNSLAMFCHASQARTSINKRHAGSTVELFKWITH